MTGWSKWFGFIVAFGLLPLGCGKKQEPAAPLGQVPAESDKSAAELDKLTAHLASPVPSERIDAALAIRKVGSKASAAVPTLINALRDKDEQVIREAATTLGFIGPAASAAIPDLFTLLNDNTGYLTAQRVIVALMQIGPAVVPPSIEKLNGPAANDRASAAVILGHIGPSAKEAIPALTVALRDLRPGRGGELFAQPVCELAANALKRIDPAILPSLTTSLIADLKNPDEKIRGAAARVFGQMGVVAQEAIPSLVNMSLREKNNYAVQFANKALKTTGPSVVPLFMDALADKDLSVRANAIHGLSMYPTEANVTIPIFLSALKSDNFGIRINAVRALATTVRANESAKPAIVDALPIVIDALKDKNSDSNIKRETVILIGSLGPAGKAAVPALSTVLKEDQWKGVRERAAWALSQMGPAAEGAVPALIAALRDEESSVRGSAADALGDIGIAEKDVISALAVALKDRNADAAKALAKLAAREKEAWAKSKMEPSAEGVVVALVGALRNNTDYIRLMSAEALGDIGIATKDVVAALADTLKDKNGKVRMAAAKSLGKLGVDARVAVPKLTDALKDEDEGVRKEVGEALKKIDPQAAKQAGVP
ncbi:MAG: HEAT repeat domain-containing protein [Planctomycetes bacterium]|nr:HEAT repeat domain-containing protein [Planctomycetota bacterium]